METTTFTPTRQAADWAAELIITETGRFMADALRLPDTVDDEDITGVDAITLTHVVAALEEHLLLALDDLPGIPLLDEGVLTAYVATPDGMGRN